MKAVNPEETSRAYAFEMWMSAPMPMVTFFKTLNVSRLVKISRRTGMKFNMLMCWCIGKAAGSVKEFYLLPVGDKLMQYDSIAVNTIVANRKGEVSSCDIPFSDDLSLFNRHYLQLTKTIERELSLLSEVVRYAGSKKGGHREIITTKSPIRQLNLPKIVSFAL